MNATQLLHDLGQSIGLDNMTRDPLDSGRPQHYVVAPGWRRPSHHLRGHQALTVLLRVWPVRHSQRGHLP